MLCGAVRWWRGDAVIRRDVDGSVEPRPTGG